MVRRLVPAGRGLARQHRRGSISLLMYYSLWAVPELGTSFVPDSSNLKSHRLLATLADDCNKDNAADSSSSSVVDQQIALGRQRFQPFFDFPLDDWQLQAGGAILQGANVIVSAPTGAGKTVVGEMALLYAYHHLQGNVTTGIYTTPLKALSNQKYSELTQTFSKSDVGLSTGDISINKGARITIMTTEVYRNIAWRSSTPAAADELIDNAVVVLDEFHYMGHPERGGVWEESIIMSPPHTQIVGLSATLSNAPALAAWMESVTTRPTVLVDVPASERPVPLRYLFATKEGLFPLFRDPNAGPGAPKGLLGYRGDGVAPTDDNSMGVKWYEPKAGFGRAPPDQWEQLPRGLTGNPALESAAAKRLKRVQRKLEKKKKNLRAQARDKKRKTKEDDDWSRWRRDTPTKPLSPREERKEKVRLLRNEMRQAVPPVHALVNRLRKRELLPAILFIFSRAGCDEAARSLHNYMRGPGDSAFLGGDELGEEDEAFDARESQKRKRKTRRRGRRRDETLQDADGRKFRSNSNYLSEETLSSLFGVEGPLPGETDSDEASPLSSQSWKFYAAAGLLEYEQVHEVASRISLFNEQNEEIAFDDELAEQYLFGVGSHHAGMLPAHKSFVEMLYRNQLMQVVFATETLAAGINMPARTTVICSMAKRGDGSSMNLLETSNLLQMAGRAGRRGMDTDGTCVIVATPFESHEEAATILTDPIQPITSQFNPSYSLAVNLVARGEGKLDVARQLVRESFAMWEKRQEEERLAVQDHGNGDSQFVQALAQERFLGELVDALQYLVDKRRAKFDIARIQALLDILGDREKRKKTTKAYDGAVQILDLEKTTTLRYLEKELESLYVGDNQEDEGLGDMAREDRQELMEQIEVQRKRVAKIEKEIQSHPFTVVAAIANEIMAETTPQATILRAVLGRARAKTNEDATPDATLTAKDLSEFSKSVSVRREAKKLARGSPGLVTDLLLERAELGEVIRDDSWDDILSITRTLVAYGCLTPSDPIDEETDLEKLTFTVTQAGLNVGMLMFENSLWTLVALGGTWDVSGSSAKLDQVRITTDTFEDESDIDLYGDESIAKSTATGSVSRQESRELVELLRSLGPNEFAGYVSCLVGGDSRGGYEQSFVESFKRFTTMQQRVIQKSLLVMERFAEVQKQNSVDESTRNCPL